KMEAFISVDPVTHHDNRIHNYQIPLDDAFPHLALEFRFFNFTSKVDGVLEKTYRPGYKTPVKFGVPMPIMGGDEKYHTSSLLVADFSSCIFEPHAPSLDDDSATASSGSEMGKKKMIWIFVMSGGLVSALVLEKILGLFKLDLGLKI
ncbi:hypothetical protein KI387_042733, partial [Taxus chinensis]